MSYLAEETSEDEMTTAGSKGGTATTTEIEASIDATNPTADVLDITVAKTHPRDPNTTSAKILNHEQKPRKHENNNNNDDDDHRKQKEKPKPEKSRTKSKKKKKTSPIDPDYLDEETLQRLKDSLRNSQQTQDILDEDALGIRMTQIDRIVSDRVSQHAVHHADLFYADSEDELYADGDEDDDDEDAEEARQRRRDSRNILQRWLYQQEEEYFLAQDFFKQIVTGAQQEPTSASSGGKDSELFSSSMTAAFTDTAAAAALVQTPAKAAPSEIDTPSVDSITKATTARTSIMNADTATPVTDVSVVDVTMAEADTTTDNTVAKNVLHKRTLNWVRKAVGMRRNGKNDIAIPPPGTTLHNFFQHRHHHYRHYHHHHERHHGKSTEKREEKVDTDKSAETQEELSNHPTTTLATTGATSTSPTKAAPTTSSSSPTTSRTPFVPFGGRRLTRGMARHTRIKRREERVSKENQGIDALLFAVEDWEKTHGPLVAPPPPSPTMRTRSAAASSITTSSSDENDSTVKGEKSTDDATPSKPKDTVITTGTKNRRKRKLPTAKSSVSALVATETISKTTKKRKAPPNAIGQSPLMAWIPSVSSKKSSSSFAGGSSKIIKVVGIMVNNKYIEGQDQKSDVSIVKHKGKVAILASSKKQLGSPSKSASKKSSSIAKQPSVKRKRGGKTKKEKNVQDADKTALLTSPKQESENTTEIPRLNKKPRQKRKCGNLLGKQHEKGGSNNSVEEGTITQKRTSSTGIPPSTNINVATGKFSNPVLPPIRQGLTTTAANTSPVFAPDGATSFNTCSSDISAAHNGTPMSLGLLDWMRRQHYVPTGLSSKNGPSAVIDGAAQRIVASEPSVVPSLSLQPPDTADEQRESHDKPTNLQLPRSQPNEKNVSGVGLPSWESVNPIPHLPRQPCTLEPPRRRHTDAQYADWCSQLLNSLTGSGRTMARHEFFYSDVDRAWFNHSDFHEDIAKLGIPATTRLSRSEWSLIRRHCAQRPPRGRFTKHFVESQLRNLDEHRDQVRHIQQTLTKDREHTADGTTGSPIVSKGGGATDIPLPKHDVPAPIRVGGTVTAYHKRGQVLHRGITLAHDVQQNGYLVQFERKELGCEFCPDTEVASHGVPDILAPASNHTVDGTAGGGFHGIQRGSHADPGELTYGTSYGPLTSLMKEQHQTEIDKFDRDHSLESSVPPPARTTADSNGRVEDETIGDQERGDNNNQVTANSNVVNQVAERESLIRLIGLVEMGLNRRKMLLGAMDECLDIFEEHSASLGGESIPNMNSDSMKHFREHYSWLNANLNLTNESLGPAMAHVQAMYGKAYAGTPSRVQKDGDLLQKLQKEQNILSAVGLTNSNHPSAISRPWIQSLQVGGVTAADAIALDALSRGTNVTTASLPLATQMQHQFLQSRLSSASQLLLAADLCASFPPVDRRNAALSAMYGDAIKIALNSQLESLSPHLHAFPQPNITPTTSTLDTVVHSDGYAAFRELKEAVFLLQSELMVRGR